ncbi:MAG: PorP/SprF family type IX secretion system membrane protein, partial [Bacteroidales bacterium]|nr:PorP/SprF family type IX secretion system membrane protein [Bacteroidales bacterium]
MKKTNNIILKQFFLLSMFFLAPGVYGQQLNNQMRYFLFPSQMNPAFTGMEGDMKVSVIYNRQWLNWENGPEYLNMELTGAIRDRHGLGVSFISDSEHILGKTGGYMSYRYKLPIFEHTYMAFGLSAGFLGQRIYFDRIKNSDQSDGSLLKASVDKTTWDINAGWMISRKNLSLGFSVYRLTAPETNFRKENSKDKKQVTLKLIRHYSLHARYLYSFHPKWDLQPSIVLRSAQGLPVQYYGEVTATYDRRLTGGVFLRNLDGLRFTIELMASRCL